MSIGFRSLATAVALTAALMAAPARCDIPVVQHVVIIFQENRTPDNLFHGLQAWLPTADIANQGLNSAGQTITLQPVPLANYFDLSHTHIAFTLMYNKGLMNGADLMACAPAKGATCPPNPAFEYVNPADVAPYFYLAENYGFANRMFQSNQGPSLPAHQYIIGGTSQPNATSLFFASDNPGPKFGSAGCDALATTRIKLVGPNGMETEAPPCFEHATLTDLIDNPPVGARKGLTWRYYTPKDGPLWNAPDAIRHMCQPGGTPTRCRGADWAFGKIKLNPAEVLKDIRKNELASVSWVIPSGRASDHAFANDGSGPAWVASIVNEIGASSYWNNTVILITWDDWGGWYDHVAPPLDAKYSYYQNGFRVPLLVVSPYTPAGYVSQQTHTFGSILRFIESAFSLPLIPPGTFADSTADDLSDFFNFNNPPRPFTTVPAPLNANFFINDKRPKEGPDDE